MPFLFSPKLDGTRSKKIASHTVLYFLICRSKDGLFEMTWCEDGSVAFLANNGKFVGTKKSGHLFANCEKATDENACYYFYLINRPVLVLKCDQGFVGYKSSASNKLECNKANYEMIVVERTDKGMVYLKGNTRVVEHFDMHDWYLSSIFNFIKNSSNQSLNVNKL